MVATACWCCAPKRSTRQRLEVAERHAAVDRASRGEGDDQGIGAPGETFGPLSCVLDPGKARFERRDLCIRRGSSSRLSWRGRRQCDGPGRNGLRSSCHTEESRCRLCSAQSPRSQRRRLPGSAPGRSAAAHPSPSAVDSSWCSFDRDVVAQPFGQSQQRFVVGGGGLRAAHPSPAAACAAGLNRCDRNRALVDLGSELGEASSRRGASGSGQRTADIVQPTSFLARDR